MIRNRFLFQKKHRLLSPADYREVFKVGRKRRGTFFTFIFKPNGLSHARLGLAIAKRFLPSAVDRNQIRRVVRERFRYHQSLLKDLDVVVLTQRNLQTVEKSFWQEDLEKQWRFLMGSLNIRCSG